LTVTLRFLVRLGRVWDSSSGVRPASLGRPGRIFNHRQGLAGDVNLHNRSSSLLHRTSCHPVRVRRPFLHCAATAAAGQDALAGDARRPASTELVRSTSPCSRDFHQVRTIESTSGPRTDLSELRGSTLTTAPGQAGQPPAISVLPTPVGQSE